MLSLITSRLGRALGMVGVVAGGLIAIFFKGQAAGKAKAENRRNKDAMREQSDSIQRQDAMAREASTAPATEDELIATLEKGKM